MNYNSTIDVTSDACGVQHQIAIHSFLTPSLPCIFDILIPWQTAFIPVTGLRLKESAYCLIYICDCVHRENKLVMHGSLLVNFVSTCNCSCRMISNALVDLKAFSCITLTVGHLCMYMLAVVLCLQWTLPWKRHGRQGLLLLKELTHSSEDDGEWILECLGFVFLFVYSVQIGKNQTFSVCNGDDR